VRRLGGLASATILHLHQGSILQAAEAVACSLMHLHTGVAHERDYADQIAIPQPIKRCRHGKTKTLTNVG